ncbi:MAG: AIR synthase related protein, partial [Dialister sp.]|nr:AIR synthase related protein [Dialister sp.]
MEETVKDVGEFGLIDRIAKDLIYRPELVVIGSGDDGAVYRVPAGYDQVISTDTMVEGIHFIKKTMRPSDVGYKLCASNFSDMAAMGADAIGFVISAALPEQLPVSWVESLYEGIRECCASYRVNLLGGDVTGSPGGVILTGTVVGMVPKGRAVTRSGARFG